MWRSLREIEEMIESYDQPERLEHLYSLSYFWRSAVYSPEYQVIDNWSSILLPTQECLQYIDALGELRSEISDSEFFLALFCKFYHHDIFFDWQESDLIEIEDRLNKALRDRKLLLPYRFGRVLYDRFNDMVPREGVEFLPADEVHNLLEETPQGIYQMGKILSGPLGILTSYESRFMPPGRRLPLWHCSDTGCNAIHHVLLRAPKLSLFQTYDTIRKQLIDKFGPPSDWRFSLTRLHRHQLEKKDRKYIDLPTLISDAVIGSERTALLEIALRDKYGDQIREIIGQPPRSRSDAQGPPNQIAASLTPEEQLQVLLILPDIDLVHYIDEAVQLNKMTIGLGEIRRSRISTPHLSGDTLCQLSRWGIRSIPGNPVVSLASTIWRGYNSKDMINELEWRLRGFNGNIVQDKLFNFIRTNGPDKAISRLILTSQAVSQYVCSKLEIDRNNSAQEIEREITRILWKLGFNPPHYEEFESRLHSRIDKFNETVLNNSPIQSEDDRESIRATGVNLFISIEEYLEKLLVFNLWLLVGDHFLETKFSYEATQARSIVPQILGRELSSGEMTLSWNTDGENTIGVLLRYLCEASNWMIALDLDNTDVYTRLNKDMPHFADDPRKPFPFRHTVLWADADPTQLRSYVTKFSSIVKLIEQSNLSQIRNGLDHWRDATNFPTSDTMLACIARMREAFELSDINRFIPKVYWLHERKRDRFGVSEYVFRDYNLRRHVLYGPPLVSGLFPISYDIPYIIAPENLLGRSNSQLLFSLSTPNEYSEYWKGYPRRRFIPTEASEDQIESTT